MSKEMKWSEIERNVNDYLPVEVIDA
eukprot:UN00718